MNLPRDFGQYELLEEIARGGMGVVYKARHKTLNRIVAVKMILAGTLATRQFIQRFRAEAGAAAALQHPNIVAIYDVGVQEGQHFFSMEYVEGQNLAQVVGKQPLSSRKGAEYVQKISEAIDYAHAQGILHRDLKPSNVLVDAANDEPRITDFGLAKRLDVESSLTVTGQMVGSPGFMPPEQASPDRGKAVRESDVYALGAILYYLLTARAPFQGESLAMIVTEVLNSHPIAPRLLNPSVPRDLETVCLKCLEKEPGKRYATARELAEELGRFLKGEPVHARPISRPEKVWLWCRRKPAVATLGAAALALFLLVVVGAPIALLRINRARVDAEQRAYSSNMRLASEALHKGRVGEVQELLNVHQAGQGADDLHGFEWRYLWHAADQSGFVTHQLLGLTAKHFLVEPRLIAAGNTLYNQLEETGQILAWDMTSWLPIPLEVPASRVSDRWSWCLWEQAALAVNEKERTVAVYRLPSLKEESVIPVPGKASQTAVGPHLGMVAVGFEDPPVYRVLVWDVDANAQHSLFGEYQTPVTGLTFSSDGKVLMAACANGEIGLWSISERKELSAPPPEPPGLEEDRQQPPFFGPDSTRLFLNRWRKGKSLEVWDWSTGRLSTAYQTPFGQLDAYGFSRDGALLACVFPGEGAVLLETEQFARIGAIPSNGARILDVALSPSGRLIASVSLDRTAKVWDVKTQRELATLGDAHSVLFTPDERSVVTRASDGRLRVWDLGAVLKEGVVWQRTNSLCAFALSADARVMATADNLGVVHVWEIAHGRELSSVQTGAFLGIDLLFSPTQHLVAWSKWTTLGILNYDSGQTNTYPISGGVGHWRPAFTADGRELAFAVPTHIMILDTRTRAARPFARIKNPVLGLAFSPDGLLLATVEGGGGLTLWDRASNRALTNYAAHAPMAFDVEFSRDGRFLASGGADGAGKLWAVVPGGLRLLETLRGHVGAVEVFFLPDSRRLVSHGSSDSAVKLWDTRTGLEVGTLFGNGERFAGFGRSDDGNAIYSAIEEGEVRVWRAPPLDAVRGSGGNLPGRSR